MDIELKTLSVSQNTDPTIWVDDNEMVYHETYLEYYDRVCIEDCDPYLVDDSAYARDRGFEFIYHYDCDEEFVIVQPEDCVPFI